LLLILLIALSMMYDTSDTGYFRLFISIFGV
jgi:hypothetical protein